ncbi:MFS transporter [Streptomyces sp. Babs14]|uniref:MFS transporter n=1 Tax=unclassified Streptomyces TaxID=2593676 RepID=UPI001C232E77|nr:MULTISPECIES: MFS transporter [unclassified Streptomyces]MBU8551988.1 MFS transporter [Streptomyces sp. Osf17]MBU8558768.1 MFS transporter [Streptomyces sp. Babs14]
MSTPSLRPSYAAVLRVPHARRTFAAALVGRLSYGTVSLALMLSLTRSTGSYAVAGLVMALFGATSVFLSPYRASLVDRHGPRRALLPMALLYAALLCVLAAACRHPGTPAGVLAATAAITGACTPPLGPTMRAVWAELLPDRAMLQRAYSLDGVAEELLFVSGPLLVGAVVGVAPPAAGVVLSALLVAVGTLAFATSPAAGVLRPAEHGKDADAPGGAGAGQARALLQPVVVAAGVGVSVSAVDLLVVAFASERGLGDGTVAWVLAALSLGSAVGGLLNGAVAWSSSARARLPFLAVGLGLCLAAAGLAPGVITLAVAVACAGLFVAPALTTAYLIADESAAPGSRTRAGAWCNTAVNAGLSAGAGAVGLLVERLPLPVCFAVSGAVAVAAALVPGRRRDRSAGRPGPVSRRPSRSRPSRPSGRSGRSPSGASGRP